MKHINGENNEITFIFPHDELIVFLLKTQNSTRLSARPILQSQEITITFQCVSIRKTVRRNYCSATDFS